MASSHHCTGRLLRRERPRDVLHLRRRSRKPVRDRQPRHDQGEEAVGPRDDRVVRLDIEAADHSLPVMSSTVMINIDVADFNDNPPVFPEGNCTVYVQEDKTAGHILLRFSVIDSDDSPIGAPFTFDIRAGNEENHFRVVQDGTLRTASDQFDSKGKDKYLLQVRVFDNGSPPLYSDTFVAVNIVEESKFAPIALIADGDQRAVVPRRLPRRHARQGQGHRSRSLRQARLLKSCPITSTAKTCSRSIMQTDPSSLCKDSTSECTPSTCQSRTESSPLSRLRASMTSSISTCPTSSSERRWRTTSTATSRSSTG